MSRLRARPTMVTMQEASNFESSRPSASNEGHSFVVRSDLTQLRCDAWLLPSDVFGHENERLARERITFGGRRSLHERLLSRSSRIMARRCVAHCRSVLGATPTPKTSPMLRISERRGPTSNGSSPEFAASSSAHSSTRIARSHPGERNLFDLGQHTNSSAMALTAYYRASSAACVTRLGRSSHRSG